MILDIISIGDELLIGQTLNTNSHWLAKEMDAVGFSIREHTSISDNKQHIINTLEESLKNVDVVLITGGLGPTNDDLTMPVLNEYFGGKLIEDQDVLSDIEKFVKKKVLKMNENNRKQALVPDNCKVVRNRVGTAPGLWFEKDNKVVVSMPGVPYEMKKMVTDMVIPWLKEKYTLPIIIHQMVQTIGVPESMLAEQLNDWESSLPELIKLAYLPSPGRVKLRLTIKGNDRTEMQRLLDNEIEKLQSIIPASIYATENLTMEEAVGKMLLASGKTLSTAESCTGGYIAHLITSVSGSSDYFKGSVVSYANEVKMGELSVKETDINEYGAVSEQVVKQMAKGVLEKLDTDYAVATSGIAGPTGGTDEKPVGTVWIAVADKNGVEAKLHQFGKNRKLNIERSAVAALGMLLKRIKD